MCRLRLDDQDASSLEGEGEEENFLTERHRQTEAVLGLEEETLLSERQVVDEEVKNKETAFFERQVEEEEENKNKETAFLVTRTDRQTVAFVVVGDSFFNQGILLNVIIVNKIEMHFVGRLISH